MKQILLTATQRALAAIVLTLAIAVPTQAETITIGRGTGIVWEGLPFNQTLSGPMVHPQLSVAIGLLAVSDSQTLCMQNTKLTSIGGYSAYPLGGVSGVGLIPRATGAASFTLYNETAGQLNGTVGLPQTAGNSSVAGPVVSNSGHSWCLPPSMTPNLYYFSSTGPRTATLSGTWVIVADGTQQAGEATIPPMYFASLAQNPYGTRTVAILPTNLTLRISTLECTVNTPLAINFGGIVRNTQVNAQLAEQSVPLVVNCGQYSDFIDANINVQLRALTSLYDGEPSRLALSQGGGYITGEIDNGVTGSGACTATTGVRFDGTPMKIGSITRAQSSVTLSNQLTWRLCSGGPSLPSGAVNASTEMLVTFN